MTNIEKSQINRNSRFETEKCDAEAIHKIETVPYFGLQHVMGGWVITNFM